jgi:hypothetical protein
MKERQRGFYLGAVIAERRGRGRDVADLITPSVRIAYDEGCHNDYNGCGKDNTKGK